MSKFTDNSAKIIAQFRKAADECVTEVAVDIVSDTANFAPKKTGELAASYKHEKTGFAEEKVGSTLERAIFSEYGTHNMTAQPHFRPAAEKNKTTLKNKFKSKVGK